MINADRLDQNISDFVKGISKGPFKVLKDTNREKADSVYVTEQSQEQDIFQCAVHQAWLDMCRTLRTKNQEEWKQSQKTLAERMRAYFDGRPKTTEAAFDGWYCSVSGDIRTPSRLTVGQAQKLINMTFKYLYCCNDLRQKKGVHFTFCHMPLDGYTLSWYKCKVDSEYDGEVWSKIDDVTKYSQIIRNMRGHLGPDNLLKKEFQIWQTEKKKVEIKGLLTCAGKIMESGACASELKDLLQDYCDELSSKYEQMNQGGTTCC